MSKDAAERGVADAAEHFRMHALIEDLSNRLDVVIDRIRAEASSADERISWLESRLEEVQRIAEDARHTAERRHL